MRCLWFKLVTRHIADPSPSAPISISFLGFLAFPMSLELQGQLVIQINGSVRISSTAPCPSSGSDNQQPPGSSQTLRNWQYHWSRHVENLCSRVEAVEKSAAATKKVVQKSLKNKASKTWCEYENERFCTCKEPQNWCTAANREKTCCHACLLHRELEQKDRGNLDHFKPVRAVSSSLSQNPSEINDFSSFAPVPGHFRHFWRCELSNFLVSISFEKRLFF